MHWHWQPEAPVLHRHDPSVAFAVPTLLQVDAAVNAPVESRFGSSQRTALGMVGVVVVVAVVVVAVAVVVVVVVGVTHTPLTQTRDAQFTLA